MTDELRNKMSFLIEKLTNKHPWLATDRGSMFSVFPVTWKELLEGGPNISFLSQWDIKRHGIVACGKDIRPFVPEQGLDKTWIERHTDWMLSFLGRERESAPYWKARNAIGFILNGARNAVLKRGGYAKAKEELAQLFAGMYPDCHSGDVSSAFMPSISTFRFHKSTCRLGCSAFA